MEMHKADRPKVSRKQKALIAEAFRQVRENYEKHDRLPSDCNSFLRDLGRDVGVPFDRLHSVLANMKLYKKTLTWEGKEIGIRAFARHFDFCERQVGRWRLINPSEEEVKGLIDLSHKEEEEEQKRIEEERQRELAIITGGGVWTTQPLGISRLSGSTKYAVPMEGDDMQNLRFSLCYLLNVKQGTAEYEFVLEQRKSTDDGDEINRRLGKWRLERATEKDRNNIVPDFHRGEMSHHLETSEVREVLRQSGLQWPEIPDEVVVKMYTPRDEKPRPILPDHIAHLIGAPDADTVEEILSRNGIWIPPTRELDSYAYQAIKKSLLKGHSGKVHLPHRQYSNNGTILANYTNYGDRDVEIVERCEPHLRYAHLLVEDLSSSGGADLCRRIGKEQGLDGMTAIFYSEEMSQLMESLGEEKFSLLTCRMLAPGAHMSADEAIDFLRWLKGRLQSGDFGTEDDIKALKQAETEKTRGTNWVEWARHVAEIPEGIIEAATHYVEAAEKKKARAEDWQRCQEDRQRRQWLNSLPKRQRTLHQLKEIVRDIQLEGCEGFTRAQLVVLLQQAGLDKLSIEDGKDIFVRVTKGCILPRELLSWGLSNEPEPPAPTQEEVAAEEPGGETDDIESGIPDIEGTPVSSEELPQEDSPAQEETGGDQSPEEVDLPDLALMDPTDQLRFLDSEIFACADQEAVDALVAMGQQQLWSKAYLGDEHERKTVEACRSYDPKRPWSARMQKEFLRLHAAATTTALPSGYDYKVNGEVVQPRLMQRHAAALAKEKRRLLLLADMGTGKSLAAQLAVMNDDAKRILIIPLNACTDQWVEDFQSQWRGVEVAVVQGRTDGDRCDGKKPLKLPVITRPDATQAWILSESLMAHVTDRDIHSLLQRLQPDAVIVDEVQRFKLADQKTESKRRKQLVKLLCGVVSHNEGAMVLALSGTAVVNNLLEAKTLVEMVTCESRPDLGTRISLANMMRLHQALMVNGVRQRAHNSYPFKVVRPLIDATDYLDEVRSIQRSRHREIPYRTERAIFPARIPAAVKAIDGPTIIAVQYVDGFIGPLRKAIEAAGYSVGVYSGEEKLPVKGHKDAVSAFKAGAVDVLLATIDTIGTGVDGLQLACNNLVIASMPWTAASYLQLIARLARSGQLKVVKVVIPTTYINHWSNKEKQVLRYSFCEWRAAVIESKRRIMDAVQDGLIPDSAELTTSAMGRRIGLWLKRLDEDGAIVRFLRPVTVPLVFTTETEELKARRHYGDFSSRNGRWNAAASDKLHTRLQSNPQEWELYHTDLEKLRLNWSVDPLQEAINFLAQSKGLVVGDFGCGTAQLAEALRGRHTVHSFDHIAITDSVVACDIAAGVPLEDNCLDYAVFSLSLMGSNWRDQLVEAWRCLKPTGQLLVWTAANGKDHDEFTAQVERAGFKAITSQAHDRWLHIWAARTTEAAALTSAR